MHIRFGMAAHRDFVSKAENAVELDGATKFPIHSSGTQPTVQPSTSQSPIHSSATQSTDCSTVSASNIVRLHPQFVKNILNATAEAKQASPEPVSGTTGSKIPLSRAPVATDPAGHCSTQALTPETPPHQIGVATTGGAGEGLPICHRDSLQIVCLSGMLALMAGNEDWGHLPADTYQTCVRTFAEEASSTLENLGCFAGRCMYNCPALEQHITFICKYRCCS